MQLAYVVVDPDDAVFGPDEAPARLLRNWRDAGIKVHVYCTNPGRIPFELSDLPVTRIPVEAPPVTRSQSWLDASKREQDIESASRQLTAAVIASGADYVYERLSLFSVTMAVATAKLRVPGFLEVTSPLLDDRLELDLVADVGAAGAHLRAQLRAATQVITPTRRVADWCTAHGCDELRDRLVILPGEARRGLLDVVA